jgi:D-alanyl-D-alanine carboxypeptidase/D-alanyl-D-alanine-endopeptidase (penicillin-binding protein 4)
LFERLAKAGITVNGQLFEKPKDAGSSYTQIAEYSTTLGDCLTRCNKDSFGLAAEALMKTIAAKKNHFKNGSWAQGRAILSKYLASLKIPSTQFNIDDASGLSRQNRLSANAITKVLHSVYKTKNYKLYKNSLAVGGLEGTIKKYFKENKYKGKIYGKTGYINGVKSFSGICTTTKGDYIFSIITNKNYSYRKPLNDIAKAIIDNYDSPK